MAHTIREHWVAECGHARKPWGHKMAYQQMLRMGRVKWEAAFTFGFLRNTFSRVVSLYSWQNASELPFDEWVRAIYRDGTITPTRVNFPFFTQMDYFCDRDGNELVEFLGTLDRADEGWKLVCERLEIPFVPLPRKNSSTHDHYSTFYDDETEEIIRHYFRHEIDKWGFRVEAPAAT